MILPCWKFIYSLSLARVSRLRKVGAKLLSAENLNYKLRSKSLTMQQFASSPTSAWVTAAMPKVRNLFSVETCWKKKCRKLRRCPIFGSLKSLSSLSYNRTHPRIMNILFSVILLTFIKKLGRVSSQKYKLHIRKIKLVWIFTGNVARALSMTNELLELVPTHQRALGNRAYYQEEMQKKSTQSRRKRGEDGQEDAAPADQVRQSFLCTKNWTTFHLNKKNRSSLIQIEKVISTIFYEKRKQNITIVV